LITLIIFGEACQLYLSSYVTTFQLNPPPAPVDFIGSRNIITVIIKHKRNKFPCNNNIRNSALAPYSLCNTFFSHVPTWKTSLLGYV
jgi:hypothetical protein